MSLEDEIPDVVSKALAGFEMSAEALAKRAGVSPGAIRSVRNGDFDEDVLRKISPELGLDTDALLGLPDYLPEVSLPPGVRRIELPFHQWTVNVWDVEVDGQRILFDAGLGDSDLISKVDSSAIDAVLITHSHPDHIGGVPAFERAGVKVIFPHLSPEKDGVSVNGFSARVLDLSGHASPAVGYLFEKSGRQIFVVGDAIFAGSMGKCSSKTTFKQAGETLRNAFSEVREDCLILSGHGPATTLASELKGNPFRRFWE